MPTISHRTSRRYEEGYYDYYIKEVYAKRSFEIMVKENKLIAEILRRDFTKRQFNILHMISTFSYPYGKETCIIPKLQDFQMSGVSKTLITKELNQLVKMNVIKWVKSSDKNEFSIISPVLWNAPYHHGYNEERAHELFLLNFKHLEELNE